jgi:hypothetical protein
MTTTSRFRKDSFAYYAGEDGAIQAGTILGSTRVEGRKIVILAGHRWCYAEDVLRPAPTPGAGRTEAEDEPSGVGGSPAA